MANLNRIILVGRLNGDPEVRFTVDGSPLAKFTLAVNRFGEGGGNNQATDFITVIAWQRLAQFCGEYLKKGSFCLVEGRIQTRSFEVDGGKRKYTTEVVARNLQILDEKKGEVANFGGGQKPEKVGVAGGGRAAEASATSSGVEDDDIFEPPDDLPF